MTPSTLLLVLASALVHATWNLWTKQIGPGARSGPLMWVLTGISTVVYAPIALAVAGKNGWSPAPLALAVIAGSGVIHVAYFLLLLRGYRVGDLSLVYPVARGTGPLLGAAGAILWLGEAPTLLGVGGALSIAAGVLVLTGDPRRVRREKLGPGLRYGLLTGLSIGVYTLWDGWSVKHAGLHPVVFYWGGEVVRVALFTPMALAERSQVAALWRGPRWRLLGIAVLSPLSYLLILLAFRAGEVSHIAPAREISILIGAYLGGRVLGEGDRRRRLVAAVAFAGGVISLALS